VIADGAGRVPAVGSTRCTGDRGGFIVNARCSRTERRVKMEAHYANADTSNGHEGGLWPADGPFQLLDVVGLDVSLAIEARCTRVRDAGFAPAPLLDTWYGGPPRPPRRARFPRLLVLLGDINSAVGGFVQ